MIWHWPQVVTAALLGFELLIHCVNDGDPRPGKYSAGVKLVDVAIWLALTYFGGFWTGGVP